MGILSGLMGGSGGGGPPVDVDMGGAGLSQSMPMMGAPRMMTQQPQMLPPPRQMPVGPPPGGGMPGLSNPQSLGPSPRSSMPMGGADVVSQGLPEPVGSGMGTALPLVPIRGKPSFRTPPGGEDPRSGMNMNAIPGGPATSWRPQSNGQLISQANQMLGKDSWENLSQKNPQFQGIMKNLNQGIFKQVPEEHQADIIQQTGNLRGIISSRLYPQQKSPVPELGQTGQQSGLPTSYMQRLPAQAGQPTSDYYKTAMGFLGQNEQTHAKTLGAFFKNSLGQNVDPRSTPWCAAFVNGALRQNGLTGTGSLAARSFLGYGDSVKPSQAQQGDIVVFGRNGNPNQGHVGFVDSVDLKNGTVRVLSGNQNNAVTLKNYPINKALDFRRINMGR